MEKENKKLRDTAKKERNETVRVRLGLQLVIGGHTMATRLIGVFLIFILCVCVCVCRDWWHLYGKEIKGCKHTRYCYDAALCLVCISIGSSRECIYRHGDA